MQAIINVQNRGADKLTNLQLNFSPDFPTTYMFYECSKTKGGPLEEEKCFFQKILRFGQEWALKFQNQISKIKKQV